VAPFETESDREEGLDGAVVQVLSHSLALSEYVPEPRLALTQRLFGLDIFRE
jgi:hypothetical protein